MQFVTEPLIKFDFNENKCRKMARVKNRVIAEVKCKENAECCICLDTIHNKSVFWTPCGHVFHTKCLTRQALGLEFNSQNCPMCRADLQKELRPIRHNRFCKCSVCNKIRADKAEELRLEAEAAQNHVYSDDELSYDSDDLEEEPTEDNISQLTTVLEELGRSIPENLPENQVQNEEAVNAEAVNEGVIENNNEEHTEDINILEENMLSSQIDSMSLDGELTNEHIDMCESMIDSIENNNWHATRSQLEYIYSIMNTYNIDRENTQTSLQEIISAVGELELDEEDEEVE